MIAANCLSWSEDESRTSDTGATEDHFTLLKGVGPEPLKIESIKVAGGSVVLQFKTMAGERYQLEHATQLDPSNWQTAGVAVTATGATTRWTSIAPAGTHFYRARRVVP